MERVRSIAIWSLLVTLVTGGVVGPPLHRAQHALEHPHMPAHQHDGGQAGSAAQSSSANGSSAHETDATAARNAALTLLIRAQRAPDALDCDLCSTRLLVLDTAQPAPAASLSLTSSGNGAPTHLTSLTLVDRPFIRGPPVYA